MAELVKGVNCDWAEPPSRQQTIATGRLIEALEATGKWWMIGHGMAKSNEPLYGCIIQEPEIGGRTLAKVEGNSLEFCVIEALERVRR